MSGDTRLWMYRKGEARLFGHPDHVPEGEDWQRFPLPAEADEEPTTGAFKTQRSWTACRASD